MVRMRRAGGRAGTARPLRLLAGATNLAVNAFPYPGSTIPNLMMVFSGAQSARLRD